MFQKVKYKIRKIFIKIIQSSRSAVLIEGDSAEDLDILKKTPFSGLVYQKYEKIAIKCDAEYHWNAAVQYGNYVYGIPTGSTKIIKYDTDTNDIDYIGNLSKQDKKWTGGCLYNDVIYGFPRRSNYLLKIDVKTQHVEEINLGIDYKKEHHYGGVVYKGTIYQPPRDTDHILAIDLTTYKTTRIYLDSLKHNIPYRYCGSFLHPNGRIYFLPELDEKIIEFNPENNTFQYLGNFISPMVFSVVLYSDGNLYGFSAYSKGILKVDIKTKSASMLHTEIGCPGVFKNILHHDGMVYGLQGKGDGIWKYDIENDVVTKIDIDEEYPNIPKISSGCLIGNLIIGLPASCNYLVRVEFAGMVNDDLQNYP